MSGLALCADMLGATVSGSDLSEGTYLPRLRARGIEVTVGHSPGALSPGAELVYSSAVPADDPERLRARELGLPEVARGALLAELLPLHTSIAVAGTHGKTTTSAMIVHILRGAGRSVDYVVGGDLLATGTNAEWHGGEWLVIETDESDRSLLALEPDIAVLTNMELDHVEEFADLAELEAVFAAFLDHADRTVVWDRPGPRGLAARSGPDPGAVATFDAARIDVSPHGSSFEWQGLAARLGVLGAHNATNAAAALTTCAVAGVEPEAAVAALADFPGVERRCQWRGTTAGGAGVIDDYAHHPTEVAAALAAARSLAPDRLVAVVRPWGRRRTSAMASEYGRALARADQVVVLDVEDGHEVDGATAAVTGMVVVEATRAARRVGTGGSGGHERGDGGAAEVHWIPDPDDAAAFLVDGSGPGTVIVALGCGDVAARLVDRPGTWRSTGVRVGALP
jgi:UDP-N-acetylmuramate--alanine ligase